MPVYSMTGFASGTCEAPAAAGGAAAAVTAELRSVNGRFLDLSLRLPDELRGLEPALRELIGGAIRRGKVELRMAAQQAASDPWPNPGADQLNRLSRLESQIQGWLPQARGLSVNEVMQWCRGGSTAEKLDETALEAARRCVEGLREARAREGARLAAMLLDRVRQLRALAGRAAPLVPQVVQRQQQRFLERWNEALGAATAGAGAAALATPLPAQALQERALNEAAAYAIRIDVAEELTRLASHLDEIERLLQAGGELGKRLDFLIQELQREANTLGSKSPALELTAISVEMKVLVEQMREQVQNLE
ncbi:MAG: YicC family protein [Proteobacteria bacterium]|nr:YicC family protein [Pseudomonadota bacterium]